ncbi:unnamed protein product [Cercopithifilaria johnstoni]|uniref:Uncharacterized protein n=1 Tax=Cercopithifilaria johnstoni TaxID=2874296 RepID=A0A8J2M375_9BILA|nr:unnamed protein product [Cercopithifilaria johnstoni]
MAFSNCSAVEDDWADADVIKEVVRDLINYVVYEISGDDSIHYRKISFGTIGDSGEISPAIHSLSSVSRVSSSFAMNPSHDEETDENVIHSIVRGLIRDILLQEKELLRRSLRKKRRQFVKISKMDHSSSI